MQASARELLVPFFTPLVWCGRGILTQDLLLRKGTLYQLSYRGGIDTLYQENILECFCKMYKHSIQPKPRNIFFYLVSLITYLDIVTKHFERSMIL